MELYRTTVVAVYNGAKPVVVRTTDPEVVRNILEDLPMEYAFKAGPTDLFAGLTEAARIARPWRPRGTTLVIVSDGDTIPATGMPEAAGLDSATVVVAGVGDPTAGRFIDGHLSRQDVSTLRQLAVRLGGAYHNGNTRHLSTDLLKSISLAGKQGVLEKLTRREYALIACAYRGGGICPTADAAARRRDDLAPWSAVGGTVGGTTGTIALNGPSSARPLRGGEGKN